MNALLRQESGGDLSGRRRGATATVHLQAASLFGPFGVPFEGAVLVGGGGPLQPVAAVRARNRRGRRPSCQPWRRRGS